MYETYDRILLSITKNDTPYAIRILRWLAFSRRPILLEEIAEIAAIDPDEGIDRDEILQDPLEVLNICSSLVTAVEIEDETTQRSQGKVDNTFGSLFGQGVPSFWACF